MNSSEKISSIEISESQLDDALNGLVRGFLSPATLILSFLYIVFTVAHLLILPSPTNIVMSVIAAMTAAILIFISISLKRTLLPLNLANPLCTFIALLITLNCSFHMYLVEEPRQTTNFMLLLIGLGGIFLSFRWFLLNSLLTLSSWVLVVYLSKPSSDWGHFSFALFTSFIVASIIYRARVINFRHLEMLRLQDYQQQLAIQASKNDLEQALNSLTTSEIRTRSIIDHMLVGLITLSDSGIILSINPAAEKMFGYKVEELIGQHIQRLFSKSSRKTTANFSKFLEDRVGRISELEALRRDGTIFPIEFSLNEFYISDTQYFAGHLRDISEQREVERIKTEFVASVSHELRTPLASISGSLSLLSSGIFGPLEAESQEVVEIAERNSKRLLNLINDILDYERLEKGNLEMRFDYLSLQSVVSRAVETIQHVASQQSIHIEINNCDITIFADDDRLTQVLVNFLSNAIKFSSPKSRIIIFSEETHSKLIIKVQDTGKGIAEKYHKQIFERFKQVEASDSRQKGGTGLGLAICKAIIERHNGEIGVESQEGKGSTFWISLPKK